jgi:hypothetical protein
MDVTNPASSLRGVSIVYVAAAAVAASGCAKAFRDAPRSNATSTETRARMPELWVDPGDMRSLDLFHGAGGPDRAPRGPSFTFLARDTGGFSPGWDVRDDGGTEWSVKLGPEAQSEVVASRIVWAMGYRQPPTYYVPQWTLVGGPQPGPGAPARFRPQMPGSRRAGEWSWEENPFAYSREFRGLLVLMRVLNNWDLLNRNNAVYEFDSPGDGVRRWYVVLDLGASLGRTQTLSMHSGTRNDVEDFERQGFVERVNDEGLVEFDQLGKWHRGLFTSITPLDVHWTCERLSRLSPEQWHDAFRAAGYDRDTAERFVRAIQARIAQGLALRTGPG